ncbi:hypothetical protein [Treponema sp. C6A8]|uniref:hypothetical protein n=1 Tax=Treponema sp. C6A8 TaxID=1410609 RepID=UPI00048041F8|nr:hypothetical protein [Treponema sp. C6A8]
MGIKKFFMFLMAAVCFSTAIFARQISVQILQQDNASEEITEKSYDIETFVLDGFFERNYIVTTSEASMFNTDAEALDLWKAGLGEALNGSSDYFVQIEVYYINDGSVRKAESKIEKIVWKVASVKTGLVINSETLSEIKTKPNGQEDLNAIAANLVKNINNAIKA